MFTTSGDSRIWYESRGTGEPVLFIQGVGLHGAGWRPQTDALVDQFACAWFDHRGTGQSDPPPDRLTVEQLAADLIAVMDALGWESAHLVGHSLGGLVALAIATQHRSRVRSLSLICTFADGRAAAPMTARMMWLGMRTRIGTRSMRRAAFLQLVLSPKGFGASNVNTQAEQLAALFGHDLADQPPVVSKQLAAMRGFSAMERISSLNGLPALVISARHDPIAPPSLGRAIASQIPAARFVELPDASHGAPIECADAVNQLLREHITSASLR